MSDNDVAEESTAVREGGTEEKDQSKGPKEPAAGAAESVATVEVEEPRITLEEIINGKNINIRTRKIDQAGVGAGGTTKARGPLRRGEAFGRKRR